MSHKINAVVFTDLDGCFLDHNSYDYAPALPALARLKACNIPVIPVTSKTAAELTALQLPFGNNGDHGNNGVQVTENGMAMIDFNGEKIIHQEYKGLLAFIDALPDDIRNHINGFNDMRIEDVMHNTGLSQTDARHAKSREASEPFLWGGDTATLDVLKHTAAAQRLKITQGGRFYHLMGQGGKDQAVLTLINAYKAKTKHDTVITIALGDGPNDADMLACVDYAVQIPNAHGHSFDIPNPIGTIIKARDAGPSGWNASINQILDDLRL